MEWEKILGIIEYFLCFFLGWVVSTWQCSKRRWCPLYLERQLIKWKKEVAETNAKSHQEKHD